MMLYIALILFGAGGFALWLARQLMKREPEKPQLFIGADAVRKAARKARSIKL